jgi:predicted neuraminidase
MAFQPKISKVYDLKTRWRLGALATSPFGLGIWSVLEPAGQQNHAPQLCWIDDERLACVWMAGAGEGLTSMSVYGSLLRKGATHWSKPKLLSQDESRSEQNPLIFTTDDGRLHLIHTAQRTRDKFEAWRPENGAFSMQWTAVLRHQSNLGWGRPWTKARNLLESPWFCRHPPLRCSDGTLLLPIYRSTEAGGSFGSDYSAVLHLDRFGEPLDNPVDVPNCVGRVHGCLVYSADRRSLLQFFRSRLSDSVYRSIGSLDGKVWTSPEQIALPNNNSSLQVIRLSTGELLAVFNRFSMSERTLDWGHAVWPRTRWPLSIAISIDDGLTWPWIRDVDNSLGFVGEKNWYLNQQLAYPSVVEGVSGDIHFAYSWGNRFSIRYVCLEKRDIMGSD